ncbi:penicillin-binding protein 2 [Patescibacteria group bacterium]|nr:MAG: penicillin-binding protein 2 [Patescibacteria group bacterium]
MVLEHYRIVSPGKSGVSRRARFSPMGEAIWSSAAPSEELFLGATVPERRLTIFSWILGALLGALLLRAFFLQAIFVADYRALAEGNRVRLTRVAAARGIFFDRNGRPLVKNSPSFAPAIVGADLPLKGEGLELASSTLARYGVSSEEWQESLRAARSSPFETVILSNRLSYEQALSLDVQGARLPGVSVAVATERVYEPAAGESLSSLLGYLGRLSDKEYSSLKTRDYGLNDRVGKSGLEAWFEEELRGRFGKKAVEVDALLRERRVLNSTVPLGGKNLRLTIDAGAQATLEKILAAHLRQSGRRRGAAVALDPRNGEVVALVSLPTYDSNLFARGISQEEYSELLNSPDQPLFNRAIAGQYPSGSTIKPIVAVAALNDGIITPKTSFLSSGGIWYEQRWFFPDWKKGGHGPTNVIKALSESVNTFFYIIGGGYKDISGLGPEKIARYAELFGLGKKLGIELPGEASGLVPTPEWKQKTKNEEWYIGDTYHMAIGQGDILVTPLQIAVMTAAVANGGTVWRPTLVDSIYDAQTGSWSDNRPTRLADAAGLGSAIKTVEQGMRDAVLAGSARSLAAAAVPVAGKTGTAQWSEKKLPHAWFTGYAPFDAPRLVITVLVEEGGEGSTMAVPVAKDFINWYFQTGRGI